jgi:outer membrane protein insertion porin family/translocation and assembly module TamA
MAIKGPVWWKPQTWFRKPPRFTPEALEADLARVEELYRSEGYYSAKITPEVTSLGPDKVVIDLDIEEGERTIVSQVALNVEGDRPLYWQDLLAPLMTLRAGEPFVAKAYEQAKASLARRLLNEGYPKAAVTGDVVVIRSTLQAVINIHVETGPPACFGATTLTGLPFYEKFIYPELTYRPGEQFEQRKLDESQRRIYNLGLFSTVLVRPVTSKIEDQSVPIEVDTTERKRYTTRVGVGYGTEDKFRFVASWTLRRFLGDLRLLTLSAKYSALVAGLEAGFKQPYFIDRKSNFYDYLQLQRDTFPAYTTQSIYNRAIVDRTLGRSWTVYGGHRLELNRLMNVTEVGAIPETTPSNSIISALEVGGTRDTTTDPYYPTSGSQLSFVQEQATLGLLSGIQYSRSVVEGRLYRGLFSDVVLALRLRLGLVLPTEETAEIPIFKRFFAGGTNRVRGYGFQSLGTLDARGKPEGGVSLTEGSFELRFPVYKKLSGVTFVDFGQVSLKEFHYDPADLLYTAGVGARYRTVVGPVRLDWAYKLNRPPFGEPGNWHVDFSIGQAF